MADLTPEQQEVVDQLNALRAAAEEAGIAVDKFGKSTLKNIDASFKHIDKVVKKNGGSYKDAIGQFEALREAIDEMDESMIKSGVQRKKLDQLEELGAKARNSILMESALQLGGILLKGYANYFVNQAKTTVNGLMGNSSPFRLAADLQIAAYDDIQKTTHAASTAIGGSAVALGGLAVATGVATAGLSILVAGAVAAGASFADYVTGVYTETEKFKAQKIGEGLESLTKSFGMAANAGAIYAGGIQHFRDQVEQSQVTQEVFSAVLSRNSANLASSGLGVVKATELLSGTMGKLATMTGKSGVSFRDQLQNLGVAIEDQGDLAAEVIGMVKRAGKQLIPEELAQLTVQYARDLKVIQGITGEDARKRVAESRAITEAFGFQTRFLEATGNNTTALEQYTIETAKWPKAAQAAIAEAMDVGAVINPALIQEGYKDVGEEIAGLIKNGVVDIPRFTRIIAKNLDDFSKSDKSRALGMVRANKATGEFGENVDILNEKIRFSQAYAAGNLDQLTESADLAANNQSDFNKSINESTDLLMKMKSSLQSDLIPALKGAAEEIPAIFKAAREKMVKAGLLAGVFEPKAEAPKAASQFPSLGPQMPARQPAYYNPYESITKEDIDALNYLVDAKKGPGKAAGGISEGPLSGYQETLHGTEAVVPLPNNRAIPVSLESGALVSAVRQQSTLLSDILRVLKDNNNLTSGILTNTY